MANQFTFVQGQTGTDGRSIGICIVYPDSFPRPARPDLSLQGSQRNFAVIQPVSSPAWAREPEYPSIDLRFRDRLWKGYQAALSASSGMVVIDSKQLTLKEAVHVDAWMQPPQYPDRFEGKYGQRFGGVNDYFAALYSSSGMVPIDSKQLTLKEAVHVDAWMQPPQYPREYWTEYGSRFSRSNDYYASLIASGMAPIDSKQLTLNESVHVEAWMQPPQYPSRFETEYGQRFGRYNDYSASLYSSSGAIPFTVPVELITIDKWFSPPSQPTYRSARAAQLGQSVIDSSLLTQKESITIDKFNPDYPVWIDRRFPRAVYVASGMAVIDPKLLTLKESVSVDRFKPTFADQIRRQFNSAVSAAMIVEPVLVPSVIPTVTGSHYFPVFRPRRR